MVSVFSEVSAVVALESGRYAVDIHPNWTIGGKPNGGYLLTMLGRAAATEGHHQHVLAASTHYLSAPDPGPATIGTELLRSGRSASQVRAWLEQDGVVCASALFTTGELAHSAEPFWDGGVPQPSIAPFDDCVQVPSRFPGREIPIMDEVDLRLDPAVLGFAGGEPSGSGELRGWLQLLGEDFDSHGLLFAVDAFPPATFEVEVTGWVPTLELTAYIRAIPAPGPLRILQRAQLIEDQRVDEICFVWDSRGRLVAQATQLAGIRLGGQR